MVFLLFFQEKKEIHPPIGGKSPPMGQVLNHDGQDDDSALRLVALLTVMSPINLVLVTVSDQYQQYQKSAISRTRTSALSAMLARM